MYLMGLGKGPIACSRTVGREACIESQSLLQSPLTVGAGQWCLNNTPKSGFVTVLQGSLFFRNDSCLEELHQKLPRRFAMDYKPGSARKMASTVGVVGANWLPRNGTRDFRFQTALVPGC